MIASWTRPEIALQDIRPNDTVMLGSDELGVLKLNMQSGSRYWFLDPNHDAVQTCSGDRLFFQHGDVIIFIDVRRLQIREDQFVSRSGVVTSTARELRCVVFLLHGRLCWTFRKTFDDMFMRVLNVE